MSTAIKPGDVLLMTRTDDLFFKIFCKWICILDNFPTGPKTCHAAIVDRNLNVATMEMHGLEVQPLDQMLANAGQCWAYRVKDPAIKLGPVLDKIDQYEKEAPKYAYMDYALLPFIVLTRKVAISTMPLAKRIELRTLIDKCCWKIENLIRVNKNALICSELAYRCLTEAGVRIEIPNASALSWSEGSSLRKNQYELMQKLHDNLSKLRGLSDPLPGWITPGDLMWSPSLTFASQLK